MADPFTVLAFAAGGLAAGYRLSRGQRRNTRIPALTVWPDQYGQFLTDCWINGSHCRAMLDTGSCYNVITAKVAGAMASNLLFDTVMSTAAYGAVQGASFIASIQLGTLLFTDQQIVVVQDWSCDCLIGAPLLHAARFGVRDGVMTLG